MYQKLFLLGAAFYTLMGGNPIWAQTDVASAAEAALRGGNFTTATAGFTELATTDADLSRYGLAWVNIRQGKFEEALNLLEPLQQGGDFHRQALHLRGTLRLYVAENALSQDDNAKADAFLRQFLNEDFDQSAEKARFERLAKQQGWKRDEQEPADKDRPLIKIGLLLPLSGAQEDLGRDLLRAAQQALFEAGRANLILYPEDDRGTPDGAIEALKKLQGYQVNVVIGPLQAAQVDAATPYAREAGTPLIPFSTSARVASANSFLINHLPAEQAMVAAQIAFGEGKRTVVILAPDNPFGQETAGAFRQTFEALGGTINQQVFFPPATNDLADALEGLLNVQSSRARLQAERKELEEQYKKLGRALGDDAIKRLRFLRTAKAEGRADFEALFLPATANRVPLLAAQLAYFGLDSKTTPLIGTTGWQDETLTKNRSEYLVGSFFPGLPTAGLKTFREGFLSNFGSAPNPLAVYAYNATKVLSTLSDAEFNGWEALTSALTRPEGFATATGAVRFMPNGLSEHGYDQIRIDSGAFTVVNAAPALLPPPLPERFDPRRGGWFGGSTPDYRGNAYPSYNPYGTGGSGNSGRETPWVENY